MYLFALHYEKLILNIDSSLLTRKYADFLASKFYGCPLISEHYTDSILPAETRLCHQ